MKRDKYIFPCVFNYDVDGITIVFPKIEEIVTCGVDESDALNMAKEALELHLFGLEEEGLEIPVPQHAKDIRVSKNQTVQLIQVYMPAVREQMNNQSVKKTLTIPKWMDSQIKDKKVNLSGIFQETLIRIFDLKRPNNF